jgi:3'-5' exonuclease
VPVFQPSFIYQAWDERPAAILCVAKIAEELQHWKTHRQIKPVPNRKLIADPPADDAIDFLQGILSSPPETVVSIDIENIGVYRGKYKTKQRNRVPYVIGFATDTQVGMSIGLAEYDTHKQATVWSKINRVLCEKKQVGQNYYTHDVPWMRYLGFNPSVKDMHDTLVRHHVLWPELSHKLDFQTFQYTREPYYKDEGKNWTVKERQLMKRYNVKDVCVTLEIFLEQEKEFATRA